VSGKQALSKLEPKRLRAIRAQTAARELLQLCTIASNQINSACMGQGHV
jgi:hypothetical protein